MLCYILLCYVILYIWGDFLNCSPGEPLALRTAALQRDDDDDEMEVPF